MLTFDEVEEVVREVYPPIGTEFSWETWSPGGEMGGAVVESTTVGHVATVVEMLEANYTIDPSACLWHDLQTGYNEWVGEGKPDPEDDVDNRYTVDMSHIIAPAKDGGWRLVFRMGVGWYDSWLVILTLDVPEETTEAELRQLIADRLGVALEFLWPRQIETA